MNTTKFDHSIIEKLYRPAADSHKGQNGRLLVIGGASCFMPRFFGVPK